MKRYVLALLLSFYLLFPQKVYAACETASFGGGSGTQGDPWQITTPTHLNNLRDCVGSSYSSNYFKIMDDIDMNVNPYNTGSGFTPIGNSSTAFSGKLNGNYKTISNLFIYSPSSSYMGLFGSVGSGGLIENVILASVNVEGGGSYVGALVGYLTGTVQNSSVTSGTVKGLMRLGGLVGGNSGVVQRTYANTTVTQKAASNECCVGGVTGATEFGGSINNSYSRGSIVHTSSGQGSLGGSVGSTYNSTGISYLYATGTITTTSSLPSNVGGVTGNNYVTATNSYWDTQTSSLATSGSGTGKTTTQMKDQTTYSGWNFDTIWAIDPNVNNGYPYLQWQSVPPGEQPTTQASEITFSSVSYNQMTINWTNGNGSKRIVFVKQASTGTAVPVDFTTYTTNTVFGSGTPSIDGWYPVYKGTGTSVTITGLSQSTDYIVQVFEYNGGAGGENYLTDTGSNNPKVQTSGVVNKPTTQSSAITFSSVQYTQMTVGWTNGNGEKRAVFIKQANTGTTSPSDNTSYTANTNFGSGTQIGSTGWYAIYNGTGTSVSVAGLTAQTDYIVQVFEYNGSVGAENYLTDSASNNPKSQTSATVTEPTTQAYNLTFTSVQYTQMTIGWTNGNGAKRIVFAKQANTGTTSPSDNTSYTANTNFGSGTQIGSTGWYTVYNATGTSVTVTGLTSGTEYIFQVFEYNESGAIINYNANSATDNPKTQITTSVTEPTTQASAITFSSISSTQMTIGWVNGNGGKRAVFIKQANTGTTSPSDNTSYTANTNFGSGTQIGSTGWYAIYNGTGTSVAITGLTAQTDYIVQVFEYNDSGAILNYLTSTASDNPKSQITTIAPTEVTLGTGTATTGAYDASPVNIWFRSVHGQVIYTAAELNAAGITGPINLTQIGFYVAAAPVYALPNYIIRMKHTTDTTVANWQAAAGMTTVYSLASYMPTAGGYDIASKKQNVSFDIVSFCLV